MALPQIAPAYPSKLEVLPKPVSPLATAEKQVLVAAQADWLAGQFKRRAPFPFRDFAIPGFSQVGNAACLPHEQMEKIVTYVRSIDAHNEVLGSIYGLDQLIDDLKQNYQQVEVAAGRASEHLANFNFDAYKQVIKEMFEVIAGQTAGKSPEVVAAAGQLKQKLEDERRRSLDGATVEQVEDAFLMVWFDWVEQIGIHLNDVRVDQAKLVLAQCCQVSVADLNSDEAKAKLDNLVQEKIGNLSDAEIKSLLDTQAGLESVGKLWGLEELIAYLDSNPAVKNLMVLAHDQWREREYKGKFPDYDTGTVDTQQLETELLQVNIDEVMAQSGGQDRKQALAKYLREKIFSARRVAEGKTEVASSLTFELMVQLAKILSSVVAGYTDADLMAATKGLIDEIVYTIKMDANPAIVSGLLAADQELKQQRKS